MVSDQPIYNIGAVERMTGIASATLRAWERRYGFPQAARTEGGHRLYSERDVLALQWVKDRIDQGMQTGQAIRAFHEIGQDQSPLHIVAAEAPGIFGLDAAYHVEGRLPELRDRLLAALLDHDLTQADHIFLEELDLYSPEVLIPLVIFPVMAAIGEAWAEGEIDISTEHMATQYLHEHLVMWLSTGPPVYPVSPVVLACAPGEWHEGSLLALGVLLRRRRWPVIYLGQSVPLDDLAGFVQDVRPLAVVLVAMREEPAQALLNLPKALTQTTEQGGPFLAFGGRIFVENPVWREKIQGFYLGDDLQKGVEALESRLSALSLPLSSK